MARAPRAKVSASSGQGVSRLSYQKGYALGNKGRADASPAVSTKFSSESKSGGGRNYSKSDLPKGFDISYGETLNPTDLAETKKIFAEKPSRSEEYGKHRKSTSFKEDKGSSGWSK